MPNEIQRAQALAALNAQIAELQDELEDARRGGHDDEAEQLGTQLEQLQARKAELEEPATSPVAAQSAAGPDSDEQEPLEDTSGRPPLADVAQERATNNIERDLRVAEEE